ncbi:MAG: glycosyltransferase [Lachnospiraceae bacterium]|jgi:glycosyltransferase involved in cell wall biosynthesis|nr:glycosyltransferase [Lachnospiraceae bacterium]
MPQISIIVPVYNVDIFLRQCLDSLLAQTFQDYELICINDGSTDSSLSILEEYASKDRRIRLFSKENEGYGKTMNLGLREAHSPYIGIVESDDFVKPEMFEVLYESIRKHQADIVKCNFYKYTLDTGENLAYSKEYPEWIYGQVVEPIDHAELYLANSSIWAALYDRRFLEEQKIRFNGTAGGSFQDISFQFKVLSSARRMAVIEDALLYYRTDNMMSSVYSPYKIYCICDEIHEIEKYICEQLPERQKKLWPLLIRRKYYDYRWNWKRLPSAFQYAFYEKMIQEFKQDLADGKFEDISWISPQDQEAFYKMMEDPLSFFIGAIDGYRDTRMDMADMQNKELAKIGFYAMIEKSDFVIIYGAGKVGRYVAERLTFMGIAKEKLKFAVTDIQEMDDRMIDGIPLQDIRKAVNGDGRKLVLLSVKGDKLYSMLNHLKQLKWKDTIVMDSDVMAYLKNHP